MMTSAAGRRPNSDSRSPDSVATTSCESRSYSASPLIMRSMRPTSSSVARSTRNDTGSPTLMASPGPSCCTFRRSCESDMICRIPHPIRFHGRFGKDLFSWIGVGYRFIPVSMHSARFEAATEVIRSRSRRFLAVDVGDLFGFHSSVWQYHVRTPFWTVVLSSRVLQRIGGIAHARSQCEDPLRCEPLGQSLLIHAGDVPVRGDVNRREDLRPYRMLDHLLMPVRPAGGVLLLPPWDEDAAMEW